MEVEFQATNKDYIDFYKLFFEDQFRKKSSRIFIFLIVIVFIECIYDFNLLRCLLVTAGYIILVGLLYYIPYIRAKIKITRLLAKDEAYTSKGKLIITDEGLASEREDKSNLRNWQSIKFAYSNSKFICITLVDKKIIIIPKRFFTSEIEAINFLGLAQAKINNAPYSWQPTNVSGPKYAPGDKFMHASKPPESKPPYLLGLLGIIPLVGAFVGVGLILYGILKYKDKWLVIIGTAGIIFTVAIYSSLWYFGTHSLEFPGAKRGFSQITQQQLNALVPAIEFYGMQHGFYPDSLQQLQVTNTYLSIDDPLLFGKKNQHFNYYHIGNKYTLFSSGIDQIPNTKDDIYPSIAIDTSKMGLIINRK